jgi:hypothetical protein
MARKHTTNTPATASEDLGRGHRHPKSTAGIAQYQEEVAKAAARKRNRNVKTPQNLPTSKTKHIYKTKLDILTMNMSELEPHGKVTSQLFSVFISYKTSLKDLF